MNVRFGKIGIVIGLVSMAFSLFSFTPNAGALSWVNDTPKVEKVSSLEYPAKDKILYDCKREKRFVYGVGIEDMCVVSSDNKSVGYRINSYNNGLYMSVGHSKIMYRFNTTYGSSARYLYIPSRDLFVLIPYAYLQPTTRFFNNLTSSVIFDYQNKEYKLLYDKVSFIPKTSYGDAPIGDYGISNNNKYILMSVYNVGVIRIDLDDYSTKSFASTYWYQYDFKDYTLSITNNGDRVAITGRNAGFVVYELNQDCMVDGIAKIDQNKECKSRRLDSSIQNVLGGGSMWNVENHRAEFVTDDELVMDFWWNGRVIAYLGEKTNNPQLDYLALGDSYSSGEGDTNTFGKKQYRAGTDEKGLPIEKCHVSLRSYPYLLAKDMSLQDARWNSIACSGAKVKDDYYGGNGEYLGQAGRLEILKNKEKIDTKKSDGIINFTPGRNKQLEFIKTYQPKVVTVTGGGNDAKFGEVLEACASPSDIEHDCDYANGSRNQFNLTSTIADQYESVRSFLTDVRRYSPNTTVYYAGYPQFFSTKEGKCDAFKPFSLNERKAFRDSVTYLNRVIKAAAESEGAIYVDIENVLEEGEEHTLCSGNKEVYVTQGNLDCTDAWYSFSKFNDECQEAFHPTPQGHALIAKRFRSLYGNLTTNKICAAPALCRKEMPLAQVVLPDSLKKVYDKHNGATQVIAGAGTLAYAQKGESSAQFTVKESYFQPNSTVRVYVTSDPTELGAYTVDSAGNINTSIPVPSTLPVGYHTLHVEGRASDGNPIEIWHIVRVLGKTGDLNDNGKDDTTEKCLFMPALGVDEDGDGVDDGCDSVIAREPVVLLPNPKNENTLESQQKSSPAGFLNTNNMAYQKPQMATRLFGTVASENPPTMFENIVKQNNPKYQKSSPCQLWYYLATSGIIGVIIVIVLRKHYAKKTANQKM